MVVQSLNHEDGLRTLTTTLIHAETGDRTTSILYLPPTEDMQELGKAITYARRYSLVALLGLVADEDLDGAEKPAQAARRAVPAVEAGDASADGETRADRGDARPARRTWRCRRTEGTRPGRRWRDSSPTNS